MAQKDYVFRGRSFSKGEINLIEEMVEQYWDEGRGKISRVICMRLNWRQTNGRLKEVALREVLLKLERRGLISLPPPRPASGYKEIKLLTEEEVNFKEPNWEVDSNLTNMDVRFELVKAPQKERLWRYLIQRYHYLGYKRIVGRYLKYFVYLRNELVALIGFADAILHHHLRDAFIGWDIQTRKARLHLIVNNVRFLILPWVKVGNLASKILSKVVKIMPTDWEIRYGYKPLFLETFVDVQRFKGTCYRAANWVYLGSTKGKGRRGRRYFFHGVSRHLYIYPLERKAVNKLKSHECQ
ncbi:MAG: DUF4338 domain-containing protein [Nitrospirae bacterium]|nr:DUF4338 domain-containing protein [Nitrospirota bacterium]